MNKIHRLIWSVVRNAWIVAPENANSRGKPASSPKRLAAALVTALIAQAAYAAPAPNALPTGGQVVAGQAAISQAGSAMTIQQGSDKAILNWSSFSIGSGACVNFQQPSASAVALNRVIGADPSAIYGSLKANGQVFLVNPNGVLFGQGARVDVGGLVASTLNIRNEDFLAGNNRFTRDGSTAGVTNQGELLGKYVALLAPEVRNEGVIAATMGTAALAAGEAVTLGLTGNALINVQVEQSSINTLVENKQLVKAEAGTVVLSAQSAHNLLGQVVNSGAIEAQGLVNDGGTVRLLASSAIDHSGSINADAGTNGNGGSVILMGDLTNPNSQTTVSGSIAARGGSVSGDGGFVETSGTHLSIADSASIDTSAANGKNGTWLLDPVDITIANTGGTVSVSTLQTALGVGNVILDTSDANSCGGVSCTTATGPGESITIADNITWSSANFLQLSSGGTINVNAVVHNTNTTGGGIEFMTFMGNVAFGANGLVKISNAEQLQLINTATDNTNSKLVGKYELANNIDASLGTMSTAIGWAPIGVTGFEFAGTLDGKGYTVSNIRMDASMTNEAGLFGVIDTSGIVRNVGVVDPSETLDTMAHRIGALAGINNGLIENSYVRSTTTTLSGNGNVVSAGGLVGENTGTVRNSYANIAVDVGVGSAATAQGGLVGNNGGTIENSYSVGAVSANAVNNGGLAGTNTGTVTNSFWETTNNIATSAGGTGKTATEMKTAATFTGWDTTIWPLADGSYPIFMYDVAGNLTVVYVRLNTGSSIYGDTPTLNWGYYSDAGGSSAITNLAPTGVDSVTWIYNSNPITLSTADASATPYSLTYGSGLTLSGYSFSAGAATDWTINKRTVTLSASKTYDGTTALTGAQVTIGNTVGTQTLTYTGNTATASNAHVATPSKYISAITLANGLNGGLASNYQLPAFAYDAANNSVSITPATLTPTLSNTFVTKVYDGTTTAPTGFTPSYTFAGLVAGDTAATLANTAAAYNDKNVLTASTITVDGLALTGITGNKGSAITDYVLDATSKTVNAAITPQDITVSFAPEATATASKVYDGNTTATVNVNGIQLNGFVGTEFLIPGNMDLANSTMPGTYSGKDAATGLTVVVSIPAWTFASQLSLLNKTSADAANYNLPASFTATGDITQRPITGQLVGTISKVYDGTANATIALNNVQYDTTGYVSGELAYINGTSWQSGTFVDVADQANGHAGSGKKVIVNITPAEYAPWPGTTTNIANYSFPATLSGTVGIITPATLTATLSNTGVTKVYDGTTNAPAGFTPSYTFTGLVAGDTAATLTNTAVAYNDPNVVNANKVTVSGLAIDGITGNKGSAITDYVLDATSKDVGATITPKNITVTPDTQSIFKNDPMPSLTYSAPGKLQGETLTGSLGTDATSTTTPGNFTITQGTLTTANNSNYAITWAGDGNLTIVYDPERGVVSPTTVANIGTISGGRGTVSVSSTGTSTTLTQQGNHLLLDWSSFGLDSGETLNFAQPSATSVAVNRINTGSASSIFGSLNANGIVFLINPSGIVFKPGAQIDVQGLVASAMSINGLGSSVTPANIVWTDFDTQMDASRLSFTGNGTTLRNEATLNLNADKFWGFYGNTVENAGTITAAGAVTGTHADSWKDANTLTISAQGNIALDRAITMNGNSRLILETGQATGNGGSSDYTVKAAPTLGASSAFATRQGSGGALTIYTVLTDLAGLHSMTGNIAIGANIDGIATQSGTAFTASNITGTVAGLGHTISNLKGDGFIEYLDGTVRDLGMVNVDFSKSTSILGGLVNQAGGGANIHNSYATGSVSGGGDYVGGLVGWAYAPISNSYATASVSGGGDYVGGLVGWTWSPISNSYATGSVSSSGLYVGGLVGKAGERISNSYATGSVRGTIYVGGLVAYAGGGISNSYAMGSVSGQDPSGSGFAYNYVGGLVGMAWLPISNSYGMGTVDGNANGALVGGQRLATKQSVLQASYADWDFTNTWTIDAGKSTPYLKGLPRPASVAVTVPAVEWDAAKLFSAIFNSSVSLSSNSKVSTYLKTKISADYKKKTSQDLDEVDTKLTNISSFVSIVRSNIQVSVEKLANNEQLSAGYLTASTLSFNSVLAKACSDCEPWPESTMKFYLVLNAIGVNSAQPK